MHSCFALAFSACVLMHEFLLRNLLRLCLMSGCWCLVNQTEQEDEVVMLCCTILHFIERNCETVDPGILSRNICSDFHLVVISTNTQFKFIPASRYITIVKFGQEGEFVRASRAMRSYKFATLQVCNLNLS
jgi:hypothetical protein